MQNKLHRLLLILQILPYAPRKIGTADIQRNLSAAGHDVSLRSVQRDLERLSESFAISSDNAKPAGWFWSKNAKIMGIHALVANQATDIQLTKTLVEPLLQAPIPKLPNHSIHKNSVNLFSSGEKRDDWHRNEHLPPFGAIKTSPKIQSVIYESLLNARWVKVSYQRLYAKPKNYTIKPLGIIVRDHMTYIISEHENKLYHFLLHLIISAETR